jgi:hypothetical protein
MTIIFYIFKGMEGERVVLSKTFLGSSYPSFRPKFFDIGCLYLRGAVIFFVVLHIYLMIFIVPDILSFVQFKVLNNGLIPLRFWRQ